MIPVFQNPPAERKERFHLSSKDDDLLFQKPFSLLAVAFLKALGTLQPIPDEFAEIIG